MPANSTPRLALPAPVGGDPAVVPHDIQNLANRLDEVVVGFDQGLLAGRPTGTRGLLYFATDTNVAYYCTAPGNWQPVVGVDAAGDLSGTLPAPSVARIGSDNLPLHTDGTRRLIRESRVLGGTGISSTTLGTLSHQGVTIVATIVATVGAVKTASRYELVVVPTTTDTGVRSVAASSAGAVAPDLLVRELNGQLTLTLQASGSAEFSVTLDVSGRGLSWARSSATGGIVTPSGPWAGGGPVGPPRVTKPPATGYHGQEIIYSPTSVAARGIGWRMQYNAASSSPYKWESTGSGALMMGAGGYDETAAGDTPVVVGNSWSTPVNAAFIDIPAPGDWQLAITSSVQAAVGGPYPIQAIPYTTPMSGPFNGQLPSATAHASGAYILISGTVDLTAVPVATRALVAYSTAGKSGGTINVRGRSIAGRPLRIA